MLSTEYPNTAPPIAPPPPGTVSWNFMNFSETIFLFVLALVIFGPKKLPEIARYVGKTLAEFRRASNEFKSQIEQEIAHIEVEEKRKQTILPPSPPPEGTTSRTLGTGSENGSAPTTEAPATLAASTEEPLAPHSSEPATEALPSSEAVTSSSSQESHA